MSQRIPYEEEYIRYFRGAIDGGHLKKVPIMADPTDPRLIIMLSCGHATHSLNRTTHVCERISLHPQQYTQNGGGVILDPVYAAMSDRNMGYHRNALNQIEDFVYLALRDKTIQPGAELQVYPMYDVPCKVITILDWKPQEFVASSIRAKTLMKGYKPKDPDGKILPVTFKVGLLYFLGEPIHMPPRTWYAPRCDMQQYSVHYESLTADLRS